MKTTLLKLTDVIAATGLSRSYIYHLAKQGAFPKPIKLSERSSAWVQSELEAWIDSRIALRNQEVA
ncbi:MULTISPECIES: AlpA family transcriptional regulator [unclassified Marinobacterium]|uniref:helix-turn-helix transcriptional regulator n=1 Tax=unclassified Marinobacterium TaxID=2644139 RepID=UPI001567FDA1|nr:MULTISPECIES: AlpA family transcriptional regulator [unclassified Marinobacterium]NRP10610.1 Prophage CP4-57 regulatory protein (AlpA) [Marinobacterium sp. xm-g-48]NRP83686.1 Prophage CP4-57 regulatory protein (AlpA) [Marinobacterium sp. xm-d-509]